LISISNYAHQKVFRSLEQDGSAAEVVQIEPFGTISTYGQELRLTGNMPFANWIVGANYDHATVSDNFRYSCHFVSTNQPIPSLPRFEETLASTAQGINSYALFANAETRHRRAADGARRHALHENQPRGQQLHRRPHRDQATTGQFNGLQETVSQHWGVKTTPVVPNPARPLPAVHCGARHLGPGACTPGTTRAQCVVARRPRLQDFRKAPCCMPMSAAVKGGRDFTHCRCFSPPRTNL